MKTKYMMSWGLAFAEKYEMKKLAEKASEGWLLDGFAFLGYTLKQGPKQELIYTLDFQKNADQEYFNIFKSAGWQHVTTGGNQLHIFSAPIGTASIYSDNEIDEGKYQESTTSFGKWTLYSGIALILFWSLMILSKTQFTFMFYPLMILTIICASIFVFCFMPYVAFKFKEKFNNKKINS